MLLKRICNNDYFVNENEFNVTDNLEYTNLKIIDKLGHFETIISFIQEVSDINTENSLKLLSICNPTHGGFISLNCSEYYNYIFLQTTDEKQIINISENIKLFNKSNIYINKNVYYEKKIHVMFYEYGLSSETFEIFDYDIVITKTILLNKTHFKYNWINTQLYIYVRESYNERFVKLFKYYLSDDNTTISYDNLNNLCIMVKNGGPQFENMLIDNIDKFDRWTILDTGSSDDTIEIINKVLINKKPGNLYCEKFINFSESRNRLLELAGNKCKYITMLDDTYVIDGDLRSFLTEVRGDQYSNSFSLYVSSDDTLYGSNRIIRSDSGLRYIYRIHEVITDKNNINIIIPLNKCKIIDRRYDYMEKRTMERKRTDLKLLFEELNENPHNPRTYYYLAQTYNLLEDYENAYKYYLKRIEIINSGFVQERYDSAFEAGRISNFKLNKKNNEFIELYKKAIQIDESRPEAYYFLGIHYYLENNYELAYKYLKLGFYVGFPLNCQFSLKPALSYHYLPKFLARVCYLLNCNKCEEFKLGFESSKYFLENNQSTSVDYQEMLSWYNIYSKLIEYTGNKTPFVSDKSIICFVADGGFNKWSGSDIKSVGVGGSETYIIEMSRYIQYCGNYDVYVFCNCQEEEVFEGVHYKPLSIYSQFIYTNYVKHVIVSRYSEYLPLTFDGFSENVYFIVHDLTPSGNVIPLNKKLKNIFCLTEWHVDYMSKLFPSLKNLISPFYYGIDNNFLFDDNYNSVKVPYSFIYSSFANRGLIILLKMWPKIYNINNSVTLNIYCDLDNEWVNSVDKEQMIEIKNLLEEYRLKHNNCYNIFYHGWVSKSVLCDAWKKSDIWFYPCIFMETFCLTAMEAAASKTLVVCNDLAGLQNTVADRGVIINGDPFTLEWQESALEKINIILNNNEYKSVFLEKNYNWVLNMSWKNQANKLINDYFSVNKLEYKGMYNWTNDLPEGSLNDFLNIISYFNSTHNSFNKTNKILEIGTYTGISLINMVKHIPYSVGYGIDKWENYEENDLLNNIYNLKVMESLYYNIDVEGLKERITIIKGSSHDVLIELIRNNERFDFIYVDGSHLAFDCYLDLVLSWELLSIKGIIAIDDYLYKKNSIIESPFESVNHFLKLYEGKYNILLKNYRVFLEKI